MAGDLVVGMLYNLLLPLLLLSGELMSVYLFYCMYAMYQFVGVVYCGKCCR